MKSQPFPLLIVDDDPVFGRFVEQLVRVLDDDLTCQPVWVDTAERALDELRRNRYELVLLDYHLPGADGLSVLAAIQCFPEAQRPAVVMLTGSGSESVAVEAMKRGARDYLPKSSLDVPKLMRAITGALAQKRLADQVAACNAQMTADLAMARSLQLSLLPDAYPAFPRTARPEDSGLRFCHRFVSTTELAGDLFSVLGLSDTQAGVFVCDVMGHGVRSALVTAMLRALLDDLAPRILEPGLFLSEMNRKLFRLLKQTETSLFATAFYLTADCETRRITCASAGHPAPLHLRRTAGAAGYLEIARGPALGLFSDASYAAREGALVTGDVLVFFTDGLYEVVDAAGQEDYGQERLAAAARRRLALAPPALLDELIADVRAFSGRPEFADDVCLLSMEMAR